MSHLGAILKTRSCKIAPAKNRCGGGSPSCSILVPILGPEIGPFLVILGVIFWISFGTLFGQLLGPFWGQFWDQIGTGRRQDGTKRAIKSSKDPKSCICKNLKKPSVFQGFWGPKASQESLRRPKKAPKREPKSSKTQQKRDPKMGPEIIICWTNFGTILGAILGP